MCSSKLLFASLLLCCSALLAVGSVTASAEESSPKPAIVGTWDSIDRHVAIGSLYQPVHGVRKREGVVYFEQKEGRLTGHAVQADHQAISYQERWKDGRTDFRKVTFADNRLMFEFEIGEWRKEAGPLAVEEGRLENKGTIRVEAVLKGDRLAGTWKMFLADGTEVFRGEWEATRAKDAPAPPVGRQPSPNPKSPPPPAARPASSTAPTLTSALVRADVAAPTRGPWGHWLRYFRGSTRDTDDMVVLAVTLKPAQEPHPPHKHVEEEFLILSEGRGIWQLDGREFPAQAGDVLFAAADTMHGIRNTGDAPLTYYMLKWNSKKSAESHRLAEDQLPRSSAPPELGPPEEATESQPKVVRDVVQGSINHGGGNSQWKRVIGKVRVIDATTLEFADGTRVELDITAPYPDQKALLRNSFYMCGQEAADFLSKFVGEQSVMCIQNDDGGPWMGFVRDNSIERAMIVNGWALADHSSLQPDEIIAREHKRGLWRGTFVNPVEWSAGKRLPGEK